MSEWIWAQSDLRLVVTGADAAYTQGWYEPGVGWIHERVSPADRRIDRWIDGQYYGAIMDLAG